MKRNGEMDPAASQVAQVIVSSYKLEVFILNLTDRLFNKMYVLNGILI